MGEIDELTEKSIDAAIESAEAEYFDNQILLDARDELMKLKQELYSQIKEGLDDIAIGRTRPFAEAMMDIQNQHRH